MKHEDVFWDLISSLEASGLLLTQLRNKPEEMNALRSYLSSLSEERQQRIREVARNAALDLP